MTGARIDTGALDRYLAESAGAGAALGPEVGRLTRLEDSVRVVWPGPVPAGGGVEEAGRQLRSWADHDADLARLVASVRAADGAGPGPSSPWLDPGTDSWVVNLARGRPSVPFLRRLVTDGPGVLDTLAGVVGEFNLYHQADLAVHDRRRLLANWGRFGRGAVDAVIQPARAGLGAMAVVQPGLDRDLAHLTGRHPGRDLVATLRGAGSLLVNDPDRLAEAQLGWEELQHDPYHWLGGFAPDAALELVSLGVAAAATRGSRLTVRVTEGAELADLVEEAGPALAGGTRRTGGVAGVPEPGAAGGGPPDLARFRRTEPDWAEAGPVVSHRQGPFESPSTWIEDINGEGYRAPGRAVNCVDCARAVEANWRGQDAVAAPLARPERGGTSSVLIENWSGGHLVPTSIEGIEARLAELGPGSSAMVVSSWQGGGAHAWNAVNDAGVVTWVDGQSGLVAPWPPPYAHRVDAVLAVFVDAEGQPG